MRRLAFCDVPNESVNRRRDHPEIDVHVRRVDLQRTQVGRVERGIGRQQRDPAPACISRSSEDVQSTVVWYPASCTTWPQSAKTAGQRRVLVGRMRATGWREISPKVSGSLSCRAR